MKKILTLFIATLCLSCTALAASPIDMLQTTSNATLSELNRQKATLKTHRAVVYRIIQRTVLPHVDSEKMSQQALGRTAWFAATPQERRTFTAEFKTLLIHTYAAALAAYTNETVEFFPPRGDTSSGYAQIDSKIIRTRGPSIPMSYRLVLVNGTWKIYDFSVEGVSVIESFRSQFAQDLATTGISGLIKRLTKHNARS